MLAATYPLRATLLYAHVFVALRRRRDMTERRRQELLAVAVKLNVILDKATAA